MTATDSISSKRWLWPLMLAAVTLLALVVRWYYVSTALVYHPIRGDATQYYAYAWNLAHHGIFSKSAPGAVVVTPDNYRDPGYPLLLALGMKLLGNGPAWYASVLLCQALLGALTVAMATQLGRYWLTERWALAAGVLMALWPHSITITSFLLTETLFGFLCTLGLLLCTGAIRSNSRNKALTAGLTLGCAALTNAVLLPFGLLLAFVLAWRKLAPRQICVALAAGALLLPVAWAVRNTQVSNPSPDSSSMGRALQNLAIGADPAYHKAYRASFSGTPEERAEARAALHRNDQDYALLRDSHLAGMENILSRMAHHPWRYAAWYLFEKPYAFWGWGIQVGQGDIYVYPTANSPFRTHRSWIALESICQSLNPLLFFLTLGSLYFAWPRKGGSTASLAENMRGPMMPVICLAAFATLVYSALQSEPRYSVPFRAFEILLATTSCASMTGYWRSQKALRQEHEKIEGSAAAKQIP